MNTCRLPRSHTCPPTRLSACLPGLLLALAVLTLSALPWQSSWAAGETVSATPDTQSGQTADGKRPYVLGETLPKATPANPAQGTAGHTKSSTHKAAATQDKHGKHTGKSATGPSVDGDDRSASARHAGTKADPVHYQPMDWEALIPPDWEPLKEFQTLDFSSMADNDPRAIAALRKLQAAWKNAPLHPDIQHEPVEMSGFIIPLDSSSPGSIEELLLVPYFGACIHVPPPPANQIIHVVLDEPLTGFQMMDPVTVRGELRPSRHDTPFGSAGYQLSARQVSAYEEPADTPLDEHP
ncbi:MAG: DUF3299 domain-containing protein [Lautropia sp.]|nr:DUF3299 domain-containing protein [Lautropia sp.]